MDDIDIKKIWNKTDEIEYKTFDPAHLDQIIEKGSVSIINKFIKTLKIEMGMNFLMLTGLLVFSAFHSKWSLSVFILSIDITFFLHHKDLIRKLSKENSDSNVLEYLQVVHELILRFIKHYKVANIILAVPLFTIGMYFANPEILTDKYLSNGWFIVLAFTTLGVAILLFYLLLFQLYGKKANKIQLLIEELKREQ